MFGFYIFIFFSNNNLLFVFKKKKEVGIRVLDYLVVRVIVCVLGNFIVFILIKDEDEVIEYIIDFELIFEKWGNFVDIVIDGGYGGNIVFIVIDLIGDEFILVCEGKGDLEI